MVAILAAGGMSSRQIAPVLGVSKSTVENDVRGLANSGQSVPDTVNSSDGITRPRPGRSGTYLARIWHEEGPSLTDGRSD